MRRRGRRRDAQQYGCEPVVADPAPETVEGEWDSNWTVVLRFPEMERAKVWCHSAEYQPLLDLRLNGLTGRATTGDVSFSDGSSRLQAIRA